MIREDKARRNRYFRTYDPVRGDEMGEVVPRTKFEIDGQEYFVPTEMMKDDFVKAYIKWGGASGLLQATGQYDTEENRAAVVRNLFDLRLKYDFELCAALTIQIQDRTTKGYIPLILNQGQRILIHEYERQRLAGLPIRVLLVKARQWGGSTATQCYFFWLQKYWFENWHSCIVALDQTQSINIRSMYKNLIARLPAWSDRVTFKRYEGTELIRIIPERGCKVQIGSSQKPDALRSFTFSLAHLSEVGLWKDTKEIKADDLIQGLLSCVPADVPGTMIVMESTAKGIGNFFYRQYKAAVENKNNNVNGIRPVFVGWQMGAEYTRSFANRYKNTEEFVSTWSEYNWWQWEQGATLNGIYWYNTYKKANHLNDFQMKSEYPTTADEAFQSKSGQYFSPDLLLWLQKNIRAPKFVGEIRGNAMVGEGVMDDIKLYPNDAIPDALKIWIYPTDGVQHGKKVKNRFLVTVDVGGRSTRADWSVISVFDRLSMAEDFGALERAALWRGHVDPDLLAYKAAQIAHYYDDALLVIESNTYESKNKKSDDAEKSEGDHTYTVLDTLSDIYDNLYKRRTSPDNKRDKETSHIGWHMNKQTKYLAYDDYTIRLRQGDYMEYSEDAYNEAMCLMNAPGGKIEAMEGTHDDIQDTTAVGNYIAWGSMPQVKIIEDTPRRVSSVVKSRGGGESTF